MLTQEGELIADLTSALQQRGLPRAFVISGPSGCGKTHLLERVAASELIATRVAEQRAVGELTGGLAAVWAPYDLIDTQLSKNIAAATVVLWDNFDLCVSMMSTLGLDRLVPSLLEALAKRNAVLVVAQQSGKIWRVLERHFASIVPLRVRQPGQATLCRLAAETHTVQLDTAHKSWSGFAEASCWTTATLDAVRRCRDDDSDDGASTSARMSDTDVCSALRRYGCGDVFDELSRLVKLHAGGGKESRGAVANSLSTSTGVLLHGPPGCGKTLLIALLGAAQPMVPMFLTAGPQYFSRYLGDTEAKLREKFVEARSKAPSVLVIEDIDAIATTRGRGFASDETAGGGASVARRVLASLLCELDGVNGNHGVLVIGTTSRIGEIDAAVLRQGRLETHLLVHPIDNAKIADIAAAEWLAPFPFETASERQACELLFAECCIGRPGAAMELITRRLTETMLERRAEMVGREMMAEIVKEM